MREDENKKTSRKKDSKKVVKLFPKRKASTIYLAGAAIILAGAMIFQLATKDTGKIENKKNELEQSVADDGTIDSLPVTKSTEEIKTPVLDAKAASIAKHFYDENATEKEQQEALIHYNNQYTKNTGTDFSAKDGKSFEVAAALSGTVINVKEDALLGNIVELQHDNDLKTVYQSLDDVQVEIGDTVAQGEVIGKAGQSVIGKDLGIHVHFEIRDDGVAVNPESAFDKTIATFRDDLEKAANESKAEENTSSEQKSTLEKDGADSTTPEADSSLSTKESSADKAKSSSAEDQSSSEDTDSSSSSSKDNAKSAQE